MASAIKYLVLRRYWPGRNQEHQLACCSKRLLRYAKANKLPLRLRKLTKSNLGWSTGTCPELHCKAFDTYVVLRFLVSEVTSTDCGSLVAIQNDMLSFHFCFFFTSWGIRSRNLPNEMKTHMRVLIFQHHPLLR